MGLLLVVMAATPVSAQAPTLPPPVRVEVADGVYLFKTAPYAEFGLDGNAVVIVTGDGVVVFDSNGTPTAARAVIAGIKAITSAPVRFVVNSHWHWDHWYGTEAYVEAYPGVQVIAHAGSRVAMAGPAIAFNRPGLESQLPDYLASLQQRLTSDPAPRNPEALRARIALGQWFQAEKRAVRHVLPSLTYTERLTLHLGGREIQLVHIDRAVTPGDTMIWLPKERVLLTGDVLVNPISFALSVYPEGWVRTLEWVDSLDASVIVPGHGDPMRDETKLHATLSIFRTLRAHGKAAKAAGRDVWTASDEAFALVREPMVVLTEDAAPANAAFRTQLVEWFMHRVYDELAGPLTDAIAPIPVRPPPGR